MNNTQSDVFDSIVCTNKRRFNDQAGLTAIQVYKHRQISKEKNLARVENESERDVRANQRYSLHDALRSSTMRRGRLRYDLRDDSRTIRVVFRIFVSWSISGDVSFICFSNSSIGSRTIS